MDKESLIEVINRNLPDGVIMLEEPTQCVLIHRDFADPLIGYSVKFLFCGIERILFISHSCRPNLHGASSLFDRTIPELKNRCYFVRRNRCKKVFVV